MKPYIEALKAETVRRRIEDGARRARERKEVLVVQWEPLETQIQRWWDNLPPTMQQRRFQIVEIAAHCHGRYRDKPALREVAAALRALCWKDVRNWTNAGRNSRFWEPNQLSG